MPGVVTEIGWQPIDSAPKDGTEFQGWFAKFGWEPRCRIRNGVMETLSYNRLECAMEFSEITDDMIATHWKPIPEEPTPAHLLGDSRDWPAGLEIGFEGGFMARALKALPDE